MDGVDFEGSNECMGSEGPHVVDCGSASVRMARSSAAGHSEPQGGRAGERSRDLPSYERFRDQGSFDRLNGRLIH